MGIAIVLTLLVNIVQGFVWYQHLSIDLLIIGTVDAILVTLVVTPIAIKLGLMERQRVETELRALTVTDDLTGLNNRRGFFMLAEQLLKMASRSQMGLYLMYIDLDYFKKINDTYGHSEGDQALKTFAKLLKDNYRESDIIARMGGDEFVLLPVGTSQDDIEVIKMRFNKLIQRFNEAQKKPWTLSATIGLAHYDVKDPCSIDELLRRADTEMYLRREKIRTEKTRPLQNNN